MFIVHHAAGVDLDELLHLVPHPRPVLVEEPVDMDEGGHCIVHTEIPHQTQATFFPQFLQLEELCKLEDLHCVLVEVGRDGATVEVLQQDLNGQRARVVDDEPALLILLHVVGEGLGKDLRPSSQDCSVARELPILANQGEVGVEAAGKDAANVVHKFSPRRSHLLLRSCLDADLDPGLKDDVSAGVKVLLKKGFLFVVFYHGTVTKDQPFNRKRLSTATTFHIFPVTC